MVGSARRVFVIGFCAAGKAAAQDLDFRLAFERWNQLGSSRTGQSIRHPSRGVDYNNLEETGEAVELICRAIQKQLFTGSADATATHWGRRLE